ncbi:hypothetical protein ACWDPC_14250, partial [Streptomyces misionensis]
MYGVAGLPPVSARSVPVVPPWGFVSATGAASDVVPGAGWRLGAGWPVAGALGKGEISLVEPLLATNLLFALALSRHQTKQ